MRAAGAPSDDIVDFGLLAGHLNARRASRHGRNRQANYAGLSLNEQATDRDRGDMALQGKAGDACRVTGKQVGRCPEHAANRRDGRHHAVFDREALTPKVLNPTGAAAAMGIAPDLDPRRLGGCRSPGCRPRSEAEADEPARDIAALPIGLNVSEGAAGSCAFGRSRAPCLG